MIPSFCSPILYFHICPEMDRGCRCLKVHNNSTIFCSHIFSSFSLSSSPRISRQHHLLFGSHHHHHQTSFHTSSMNFPFVSRFIEQIAQRSMENFIRFSCFIVDRLHVHSKHGLTVGRTVPEVPKKAGRTGTIGPTNGAATGTQPSTKPGQKSIPSAIASPDIHEDPCFTGSDDRDNRAAVNLDRISSHANNRSHAKGCECDPCRDKKHAFSKFGSVRRRGPCLAPIRARMPPRTEAQGKILSRKLQARRQVPKRRRLDLGSLQDDSNRFALLPVERTGDGEDSEPDTEALLDSDAVKIAWQDAPPKRFPTPFPIDTWTSLLDNETDSELDTTDSESEAPPTPPPFPTTADNNNQSLLLHLNTAFNHPHTSSCPCRLVNLAQSDVATDGGSDSSADHSKLMPWEEDDWAGRRKELGIRALGWTNTRTACKDRQGAAEVEVFVGEAEWL